MNYKELYKKCTKENKACSYCKFYYADPMLYNIPVDEAPPMCMNIHNKSVHGWKLVMPWSTCELWQEYVDEELNIKE